MNDFDKVIADICKQDKRYDMMAYYFVRQALDHTLYSMKTQPNTTPSIKEVLSGKTNPEAYEEEPHVSGQQLLEGIRMFVLEQYGPLSLMVLNHWGIRECSDFGHIVFNMVDKDILGRSKDDKPEDFRDGYDFKKAFEWPFLPQSRLPQGAQKKALKSKKTN